MQVGDILDSEQLDKLPVGSVVVHDEPGNVFNTVTRTPSGFTWTDMIDDGHECTEKYGHGGIYAAGGWTLVHLPAVPALKVGDVIETEAQADALPVGTVAVDDDEDEDSPEGAPAIKVGNDRWLFHNTADVAPDHAVGEAIIDHRVVYIPARANTGAGSTAA